MLLLIPLSLIPLKSPLAVKAVTTFFLIKQSNLVIVNFLAITILFAVFRMFTIKQYSTFKLVIEYFFFLRKEIVIQKKKIYLHNDIIYPMRPKIDWWQAKHLQKIAKFLTSIILDAKKEKITENNQDYFPV